MLVTRDLVGCCVVLAGMLAVRAQVAAAEAQADDAPQASPGSFQGDRQEGLQGDRQGGALVQQFNDRDANGDGKLTQAELSPALFEFLNADGDDHVTLDEARKTIRSKGLGALQQILAAEPLPPDSPADKQLAASLPPLRQGPKRLTPGDCGVGRMLADLSFTDLDGQTTHLSEILNDRRAAVIAFTNTSCPISKKYAPTLAALEARRGAQGVAFVFVNPTTSDALEVIRESIAAQGFTGSYVRDNDGALARALGATHTTDVFLVDSRRTVIYRGAVDDQYGFGYSIDAPRVNYLDVAIDATLANELPRVAATEAPGCPLASAANAATVADAPSPTTYHNRISRIVQRHCLACHRAGGVAPFALESYEEVTGQAGALQRAVEQNIMPPWFAATPEPGAVSPFANDCSLAESDKAALLAWLAGVQPAGDPLDAPHPREFASGWQIGEPDLVVQIPEPIAVKASGTMPYQWVTVDTGLTEDKYVKAFEVKPTARDVVHHCLVFALPPAQEGEAAPGKGSDEPVDGATGFFAAYAPGYTAIEFNEGFGKLLPAGSRLRFQLHYTPNGTATVDQSMIGITFADKKPERLVAVAGIAEPRLSIPPGADNHQVTASVPVPNGATVLAFFPHMHLRGKAFRYEAILPDGTSHVLLDVPRYDFNWQASYRLAEPLALPAGSTIKATAWYDNSSGNPANPDPTRTVPWGPQTYDEMMIGYVEYHMDDAALNRGGPLGRKPGGSGSVEVVFKRFDRNGDGLLTSDEIPEARREALLKHDTDQDGALSLDEAKRLGQLRARGE